MYTVASDVYLNALFNSDIVKEYRLIGFDNQKSALTDKSTTLEGGEVGSGHSLMAVFEILPNDVVSLEKISKDVLLASLQLSYKNPLSDESIKDHFEATNNYKSLAEADTSLRFASSVIMFGLLLKQSTFSNSYSWDDVYNLAIASAKPDNLLQKEFIDMVGKAKKIYPAKRKK
ncbi:MAG: YfbK domain-containing protein, partial [Segetibacter sp.]